MLYKKNMKTDSTNFSTHVGGGVYNNTTIDKNSLEGEIDRVVPEASSAFPTTWPQKRAVFFEALTSRNEKLLAIWFHPENSAMLKELIGVPDLYVPDENQRTSQLWEIAQCLKGMPVQPNPQVDNALAHIAVIQAWASGDEGRDAMMNNQQGFMMVMMHLGEHLRMSMGTMTGKPEGTDPLSGPADVPAPGQPMPQGGVQ